MITDESDDFRLLDRERLVALVMFYIQELSSGNIVMLTALCLRKCFQRPIFQKFHGRALENLGMMLTIKGSYPKNTRQNTKNCLYRRGVGGDIFDQCTNFWSYFEKYRLVQMTVNGTSGFHPIPGSICNVWKSC